jgi:peptidoglycan/LPS O-acetylase OafA/YrhL
MLRSLQACRALAALLVVLYHTSGSIFALPKYFGCKPCGDLFDFGGAGVDFFFVLSGFLIAHVHAGDLGQPQQLRAYLWKRLSRIYPTYWAVLLLVLPVFLLAPRLATGRQGEPLVILGSFLLLPLPDAGPVLVVAWTLSHELLFYLLFATLIASRRWGAAVFTAWLMLLAAGVCGRLDGFPWTFLASPYNLEFLAGLLLGLKASRERKLPDSSRESGSLCSRLAVLLGTAIFLTTGMIDVYAGPLGLYEHVLGYGSGSVLALAGLIEAERSGRLCPPRLLTFLGDASYSIYLTHFPALSVLAKLVKVLGMDGWVPPLPLYGLLAGGAVAAGCVFHVALERPLLRCLRPRTAADGAALIRIRVPSRPVAPRMAA